MTIAENENPYSPSGYTAIFVIVEDCHEGLAAQLMFNHFLNIKELSGPVIPASLDPITIESNPQKQYQVLTLLVSKPSIPEFLEEEVAIIKESLRDKLITICGKCVIGRSICKGAYIDTHPSHVNEIISKSISEVSDPIKAKYPNVNFENPEVIYIGVNDLKDPDELKRRLFGNN